MVRIGQKIILNGSLNCAIPVWVVAEVFFGEVRIGQKIILKVSLNRAIVTPTGLITQLWGRNSYRIEQSMVKNQSLPKKRKNGGGEGL